jgi:hypothetical protein
MAEYDFSLNPRPRASLLHVGVEREPVLVVDDLMLRAEALIDYAAGEVEFEDAGGPQGGYPGLRAPAPLPYVNAVVRGLDPLVREAFGLGDVKLARAECRLSMVTLPPGALKATQRVPHVDTFDPLQFAFLHFLCDPRFGGTAFYRQRASGFEAITEARGAAYTQARDRVIGGAEADYIRSDTADYERIGAVEARFDRLIVYRSRLLHSGLIPSGIDLPADPRRGRLTANIFVGYAARS